MPWRNDRPGSYKSSYGGPGAVERIVSVLCYLTGGIVGIIYIIISRSHYQSDFFRFHFLQSIVLAIISLLLSWALQAIPVMLGPLLGLAQAGGGGEIIRLINQGVYIILLAYGLLPLYGAIMAALGKYAQIPYLSDVVRNQMR